MKIEFNNGSLSVNIKRFKGEIVLCVEIENHDLHSHVESQIFDTLSAELLKRECETFLELKQCSDK